MDVIVRSQVVLKEAFIKLEMALKINEEKTKYMSVI
jgi:hypothetical protein